MNGQAIAGVPGLYPDGTAAFQSGAGAPGGALFEYDTAAGAPVLIYGSVAGEVAGFPDPIDITPVNDALIFNGLSASGSTQTTLWVSGGNPAGETDSVNQSLASEIVGAATSGQGLNPSNLTAFDGNVYFNGTDAEGQQGLWELASSDGAYIVYNPEAENSTFVTASGFELTGIANASPGGVDPQNMVGVYIPGGGTDITFAELLDDLVDPSANQGDYVVVGNANEIQSLTPADIIEAKTIGLAALYATDGPVALTVAQAQALEDPVVVESGAVIVDTAADIEAMAAPQMTALAAVGVDQIDATDTSLTLTLAQYDALKIDDIAIGVPSGDSTSVRFVKPRSRGSPRLIRDFGRSLLGRI